MKKHTQKYLNGMRYTDTDFIPCECCGKKAVDIHHIEARGMGGTEKDHIENLMALCRPCHLEYGDKKVYLEFLKKVHLNELTNRIF